MLPMPDFRVVFNSLEGPWRQSRSIKLLVNVPLNRSHILTWRKGSIDVVTTLSHQAEKDIVMTLTMTMTLTPRSKIAWMPTLAHLVLHEPLDDVEAGLGNQVAQPPPVAGLQPRPVLRPQRHGLLRRRRRAQRPDAGDLFVKFYEDQLEECSGYVNS